MVKRKKKKALRRPSFVFRDTEFFEDPCREYKAVYAIGGKGKDGSLGKDAKPVLIVGPAAMVRQIKAALRKFGR